MVASHTANLFCGVGLFGNWSAEISNPTVSSEELYPASASSAATSLSQMLRGNLALSCFYVGQQNFVPGACGNICDFEDILFGDSWIQDAATSNNSDDVALLIKPTED